MRKTILPEEMKLLEQHFMTESGVPGALLMEHAAMGICDALARYARGGRVLFLCGPGNNGGDGYAAARIWQTRGGRSVIYELTANASGDALMNRGLAQSMGIPVLPCEEAECVITACDAVCDALFGTGLSRDVTGTAAVLVELINDCGLPVVAVDIPSGLNGATGRVMGCAVRATETVTFHRLKQGLAIGQSADYTGRLTVHPILIPEAYGETDGYRCLMPDELAPMIPKRKPGAHKGSCGRTVILAGSMGMAGAAALCARAAIRAGSGLTCILARASIVPILQTLVPGATCTILPEENGHLTAEAPAIALEVLKNANAAAVGCGLGQDAELIPLLQVFRAAKCPVVWDADALNLLAADPALLPLPINHFATPHPGEAARLLNCTTAVITGDAPAALHALHEKLGCSVLLKGARTLMTDGTATAVNVTGSPSMAKGGSGDVLTGLLAALLAGHVFPDTLTALQAAALIHGMAGIRSAELNGVYGATPEALADCIRVSGEA